MTTANGILDASAISDLLISASGRDRGLVRAALSGVAGPFGPLQPVTQRLVYPEQNLLTSTALSRTFRSVHVLEADCPFVRIVWVNAGTPADQTNAITISGDISNAPAGTSSLTSIPVRRLMIGGQLSQVVQPRGFAVSDPIWGPFRKGDMLVVSTVATVGTIGDKIPIGMTLNWGFDGYVDGDYAGVQNASKPALTQGTGYSPCLILGPVDGQLTGVAAGDSINDGAGDNGSGTSTGGFANLGPVSRAFFGNAGLFKICAPGERVASVVASSSYGGYAARGVLPMHAKVMVSNYGTNDVGNGDTLATIQANLITFWRMWPASLRHYQQTIDPRTTSSDSFKAPTDQTVRSGEAVRTSLNDWLRDGAPINSSYVAVAVGTSGAIRSGGASHPLAGVIDTAAVVEVNGSNVVTLNGGFWITNGSANWPTSDGIHNSAVTSALKAAVIRQAIFGY